MSHPYDPNSNPQSQPSANPYDQPASSYPPSGQQYPPAGQGQYQPQPYGQPYGTATAEHPQGTIVFVLGIVGIFVGVCAPIAWILGNKALNEIRATGATYTNESQIRTGRMLGKVFTIIYLVFIVLYIVFLIIVLASVGASGGFN